jgi:hypothetical protein
MSHATQQHGTSKLKDGSQLHSSTARQQQVVGYDKARVQKQGCGAGRVAASAASCCVATRRGIDSALAASLDVAAVVSRQKLTAFKGGYL